MTPSALSFAKVMKVHPKNGVDLLMLDTGARIPRVQVMAVGAATDCGTVGIADPTEPETPYSPQQTKVRDTYAIVGYVGNVPVVLGFLYPQISQMFFEDIKRTISRDESDFYTTIDGAGNYEMHHPSGTFLRIAVDPEHEDLTGQDIDGKWKIERNTDAAVHVRLVVKNGGAVKADLTITPDGNVALDHVGDLTATTGGNATVTVEGTLQTSASNWTHTGPVTFTSNVQVQQTLTAATDVIGGGKSLKTHVHTGVAPGGGVSGPPQ